MPVEQAAVPEITVGILEMITNSGAVVLSVLIMLIVLSVVSWAITIAKIMQFRKAKAESEEFSALFWETRNFARVDDSAQRLVSSPLVHVFHRGYRELTHILQDARSSSANLKSGRTLESDLGTVERVLERAEFEETMRLERGITFLATVASSAPFVGLFGTVWGIMTAFSGLSSAKSTTLQAVAPGISEALIATAIGLAAAIPAAVAYNYFAVGVRRFRESMQKFSQEFLNVARRYCAEG